MRSLRQSLHERIERAKERRREELMRTEQTQRTESIANLRSKDPRVIAAAARHLGGPSCSDAVGPLIQVMREEIWRRATADRSGGDPVMQAAERKQRDPHAEIRFSPYEQLLNFQLLEVAEHALLRIGAPAVPALITVLEKPDPGDRELLREVAWLLGKLKAIEAVRPLSAALTSDDDLLVARAKEALQAIGGAEAEKALADVALRASKPGSDLAELLTQLRSDVVNARAAAADRLGQLADSAAVQPLVELMREESLKILAGTMGLFGRVFSAQRGMVANQPTTDPESHERLIKAGVRRRAANALGRIGAPAVPALIQLVEDPDERFLIVREEAARVLGELKAAEAVGPLAAVLSCGGDLAAVARASLERIGGTEAQKALTAYRVKTTA
ncbi:MAG: HEAT repeat domain-containing protein [Candidatus Aminicenantes bacterium]|nr:HEAT repeat domain-containing protein [Candidatus Aminicenantes bacterium]